MWKEEFRLGVDVIDIQHKSLFDTTEELIELFRTSGVEHKQKCIEMILFLKDYAVQHFADEEAYQRSINHPEFDDHKLEHEQFVQNVLQHESAMLKSDFSRDEVQNFIASLVTWLVYHVAGSDQKIKKSIVKEETPQTLKEIVHFCVCDVLSHISGINKKYIEAATPSSAPPSDDEITIAINFSGGITGRILFTFPRIFAKNLVYAVMNFVPRVIDEFETAVLYEVLNLVGNAVCGYFTKEGEPMCEVSRVSMAQRKKTGDTIALSMELGTIEADIELIIA